MDTLTPAEVKSIAAEIDAWHRHASQEELHLWRIRAIVQLSTPFEAYEVVYEDGASEVWYRNDEGRLEPAERLTYYAPEYRLKGQK